MHTLLYATILIGATFLWGYLFYKKDYHPQPLRVVAQIFGIGLFSMLPVFAYRAVYQNVLPTMADYRLVSFLTQSALGAGLFYFLFNLILLSVVLFSLSGILAIGLTIFKKDTLKNILASIKNEEFSFMTVSVMIGLLILIERLIESVWGVLITQAVVGTVLFLTIIEEYVKHLIVRFTDDKRLKDVDDAITLSIMVGLAFSLIETAIYVVASGDINLIFYRAFLSLPVHLVASGIFGYYYGLAHFAKPLTNAGVRKRPWYVTWFHRVFSLKRHTVYTEEKMIEGLGLATLFHATCNVLFELNLAFVVVPILVFGLMILSYFYRESYVLYRLIHAR